MRLSRLLLAPLLLLAWTASASAQTVELRSRPADNAAVLGTLDAAAPALAAAEPVPDGALAALGWRRFTHSGTFTGYVPRRTIGKGLTVATGTMVRVAPEATADLLTIVAEGDNIEVVDPQVWATVRVTKAIPVFVRLPVAPPPPATPEPVAAPIAMPEPAPAPPPPLPEAVPSGVIFDSSAAAQAIAGSHRILEGTLREVRHIPGFTPRHRFELLDRNGRRFAFVRLDDAVLAGTLTRYLGEVVTLYGRVDFDGSDLVVGARVVRLRHSNGSSF